ncbi:hypothetical protein Tco_1471522, partial [Tanacetum coccineum]
YNATIDGQGNAIWKKFCQKLLKHTRGKACHAKEDTASRKTTMPANAISLPSQQTTRKMIEEEEAFNLCSGLSVEKPPVQTTEEY